MRKTIAVLFITGWLTPPLAADQQADRPRGGRGWKIGAIVGAAGGFALGLIGGLTWFDDAVDSERKIWITAFALAAAGGAGGYFIGRSLDGRAREQRAVPRAGEATTILLPVELSRKARASASAAKPFARLFAAAPQSAPFAGFNTAFQTGAGFSKGQYP